VQVFETRRKVAQDFYLKQGFDSDQARSHIKGIDFNKPVEVVQLKKGTVVEQWQILGGAQGNYYAPLGSPPSSLGISPQAVSRQTGELVDRIATKYILKDDVEVLRSTASKVTDTWSIPGKAVEADGGGTQFFSTNKESFKGAK
jgi:Bacterial toxin 46